MNTKEEQMSYEEFIGKVESWKKKDGVDLSTAEDLSLAVMNLISLEEHFFFTGAKTNKDEYFNLSNEVRGLRKKLLAELMPHHEGETWCISKHLLSTTMRLIEVGNKLKSEGDEERAKEKFMEAYKVYSIFWALKLELVEVKEITKSAKDSFNTDDLVKKLAHCCDE